MPGKINDRSNPGTKPVRGRAFPVIYLILIAAAWVYIWLRAAFIPFQSDEAATFFMYVQPGNFFPPFAIPDANNHILNSFLTWISFKTFGSSPLALRLPNILSALLWFYFVYKIALQIRWMPARWGFILLTIGTHFLLEFFGYSRGYGLSMAFLAGMLYEIIIFIKNPRFRTLFLAVLFTILATAANLNLIFICLSVSVLLVILIIFQSESLPARNLIFRLAFVLVATGLSSYYFIDFSMQIRKAAGFYYGAPDGFWPVTVESLSAMITGRMKIITEIIAVLALSTAVFFTLKGLITNKIGFLKFDKLYTVFLVFILISWISAWLLNRILQINYQEDRAAMYLVPLLYGMVFFGIDSLYPVLKRYTLLLIFPFLIIPASSLSQISLDKTVYGNSQQVPVEFYDFISRESAGREFPPAVSSYQARRQVWAFMNFRSGGFLNLLPNNGFPDRTADFLIDELILPDSLKNVFEPVISDKKTQTALFRNKRILAFRSVGSYTIENPVNPLNLYNDLYKVNLDSAGGKSLRVEAELTVESPSKPLQAALVAEVFDSNRKTLAYEAIDLDLLRPAWGQQHHTFKHIIQLPDLPANSKSVLVYFWNKKKVPVKITGGQIDFRLSEDIK